jgi:hypothetical protein
LLISSVLTTAGCQSLDKVPSTDSFCALQDRTILTPADSAAIKALPDDLKRRIVKNETRYRCICQKWQNPICGAAAP